MISRSTLKKTTVTLTVLLGLCAGEAAFRIADAQACANDPNTMTRTEYMGEEDANANRAHEHQTLHTAQDVLKAAAHLLLF